MLLTTQRLVKSSLCMQLPLVALRQLFYCGSPSSCLSEYLSSLFLLLCPYLDDSRFLNRSSVHFLTWHLLPYCSQVLLPSLNNISLKRVVITNVPMGDNGSSFSKNRNGNQSDCGGGGGQGGLGPPPISSTPFPTSSHFARPTNLQLSGFRTSASSSTSRINAAQAPQTSGVYSLGLEDSTTGNRSNLNGGIITAIIVLILVFLSVPIAFFFYRRTQKKRQHRKPIKPPPSSRLPLYEFFTARSIYSNRNSFQDMQKLSLLDAKPLPPNPEEHPTFRISILPPARAHLRSSLAMTERSISVYSDTNLYFITSKEIGMETRLPSRLGEMHSENDNPFRESRLSTREGERPLRLGLGQGKEEGECNPFERAMASPVGSPKFMIGEGKWRRPYMGKLRPGMGVQRALTPNTEE
jgi:hypothetical protein